MGSDPGPRRATLWLAVATGLLGALALPLWCALSEQPVRVVGPFVTCGPGRSAVLAAWAPYDEHLYLWASSERTPETAGRRPPASPETQLLTTWRLTGPDRCPCERVSALSAHLLFGGLERIEHVSVEAGDLVVATASCPQELAGLPLHLTLTSYLDKPVVRSLYRMLLGRVTMVLLGLAGLCLVLHLGLRWRERRQSL